MLCLGVPALLASFLSLFQKETTGLALTEEVDGTEEEQYDPVATVEA